MTTMSEADFSAFTIAGGDDEAGQNAGTPSDDRRQLEDVAIPANDGGSKSFDSINIEDSTAAAPPGQHPDLQHSTQDANAAPPPELEYYRSLDDDDHGGGTIRNASSTGMDYQPGGGTGNDRPTIATLPPAVPRASSEGSMLGAATGRVVEGHAYSTAPPPRATTPTRTATASPNAANAAGSPGGGVGGLASKAFGSLRRAAPPSVTGVVSNHVPNVPASLSAFTSQLTARRYTLPDRTVASQVLMYRQLLHTECKPGLRLSRSYQATPAQRSVKHMPWWEKNVEQTRRMVISYDNLITRLWIYGVILPFATNASSDGEVEEARGGGDAVDNDVWDDGQLEQVAVAPEPPADSAGAPPPEESPEGGINTSADQSATEECTRRGIDTMMNEKGLPPIPHPFWVSRAGFQQDDPVTDFRSGGVLSLAMLLHVVESCPPVHARFLRPDGDASVLPFGITSINVTDMLAKICMFSRAVDKIDALLSSKPFWRMFADPNALLVTQELSMDILADVVVEVGRMKRWEKHLRDQEHWEEKGGTGFTRGDSFRSVNGDVAGVDGDSPPSSDDGSGGVVTVFDFPIIMERTERRVRDDLLNAGPRNVEELRSIATRLKVRYARAAERKEKAMMKKLSERATRELQQQQAAVVNSCGGNAGGTSDGIPSYTRAISALSDAADSAEGFFSRFREKVVDGAATAATATRKKATTTEPEPAQAPPPQDLLDDDSNDYYRRLQRARDAEAKEHDLINLSP